MQELKPQLQSVREDQSRSSGVRRLVINRQEREMLEESSVWRDIGVTLIAIAAGAAIGAVSGVSSPGVGGFLWATALWLSLAGIAFFIVHHDVNRGRRVRRSQVIEEYVEET